MSKLVSRCWAAAICVLVTSVTAHAECVWIQGNLLREVRAASFVFDGTVLRVERVASDGTLTRVDDADLSTFPPEDYRYATEYAATLEVHRVWKGEISRHITVHFVYNVDGPVFPAGSRQIVFARPQSEDVRKGFGIAPGAPHRDAWVGPCSGRGSDDEEVSKQLGPGRKPSDP